MEIRKAMNTVIESVTVMITVAMTEGNLCDVINFVGKPTRYS